MPVCFSGLAAAVAHLLTVVSQRLFQRLQRNRFRQAIIHARLETALLLFRQRVRRHADYRRAELHLSQFLRQAITVHVRHIDVGQHNIDVMLFQYAERVDAALASRHLLRESGADDGGPMFVLPRGWVMFIGILCFIMFLAEGSMLDWSALFLTTLRGVEHSQAGLGYALFSITMTLGRLNGDRVVNSLGRYRVLLLGSLCAAFGLGLAIAFNHATVSLAGFMLVGLGASNVVPILFSAAGNQRDMPANLAIASVTTVGYAGILAGPALIGFIAQFSNLTVAFACVAALLLAVTASARAVTR